VKETDNSIISFNSRVIAKNTIYNLLGNIIPTLFAITFIPPLIKGLGTERFGILSIAWMIVGYFSFFDFGIGRGLTKVVAERIGLNQTQQVAKIFWSSIFLMIAVSVVATLTISLFVPFLASLFNISAKYKQETIDTFFLLACSIPIITTMAGLRGILEAYQKFATINLLKIFLGAFTFLGPLLVLIISNSLFWIVFFLIFTRIIIWVFYLVQCFKVNDEIKKNIRFDLDAIKPVLRFSIWMTLGNIIVPIIMYSDRFLIGTLISATAITFYVTPYEVITKLLLISIALSGVLFPVFSGSYINTPEFTRKILIRGIKFILLTIYPIVIIVVTFAYEGIDIWLGKEFAEKSSLILQFLAVGILMNSMSLIPNIFFQGIGKPKVPTLINLVEFPIYLLTMWFSIKNFGINGAAFTFMTMATLDAIAMYFFANKMRHIKIHSKPIYLSLMVMVLGLLLPFLINNVYMKSVYVIIFISVFIITSWKFFLSAEEKSFIVSNLQTK
jgi:O-antigen/teichoic acid export membrane protein